MPTKDMTATLTFDQLQTRNSSVFEKVSNLADKFSRRSHNACVLSLAYLRFLRVEDLLAHLVRDLSSPAIERLSSGQLREIISRAKELHSLNQELLDCVTSMGLRTNFFYAYAINRFEAGDHDLACRIRHLEGMPPLARLDWDEDELADLAVCLKMPAPAPNTKLTRALTAYKADRSKTLV